MAELVENANEVTGSATIKAISDTWGYKSQLQDLIKTVSTIKNVLLDAYSKRQLSHETRGYIEDLKAAVYDADDLLDEFFSLAKLKLLNKNDKLLKRVRRFFGTKNEVCQAYRLYRRLKKVKWQLDTIFGNHHKFGLSVVDYNPISDAEENQQNRDQANFHVSLSTTSSTNSFEHIPKTIRSKTLGNRDSLKWVFVVLNVVVEICQATFSQVKNQGKMRPKIYFILSIITSSICLMMALLETFREGMGAGIVWRKRGYCCWFRYPGNEGRLFGRFSLYFGLISSMIQLIINLLQKLTNKDIVKFDYTPLLLAICYMVAAIIGTQEKTPSAILIRCNVHGSSVVEGTLTVVEGHESMVFQCPHCQRGREEDRVLNRC